MQLNAIEISELIQKRITQFEIEYKMENEGKIISVVDGIIKIYGLSQVMQGEMLLIPSCKTFAIALNLERDSVSAIIMGPYTHITENMTIKCTGKILEVPVGEELLGRVVNTLGEPIDGKGIINYKQFSSVENHAPNVINRKSIHEPIQTGYKCIDTIIPIGKGQRELIIGDRQTGKTTLAIDTIINQKKTNIKCIYVSIGQKISNVVNIVEQLKNHKALHNTIILVASASESAALQYLSPYSGCSMGEYFRNKGEDALIIYDDLSKHAIAYRQISLLLKRPPGREAYPGDIFYLHSRLLERSACINENYVEKLTKGKIKNKTGSLTALPIIETQEGDVSAFVPTNVISITDGQIFLESNLFNSGIRPAVNPGISVSRIGSAAQTQIIKKLSGGIRTALAQYRELEAFSQFSSDLDDVTKKQLINGQKITELLKQKQHMPLSIAEQAILLFASENNYFDDIEVKDITLFEYKLLELFNDKHKQLIHNINKNGLYNEEIKNEFHLIIKKINIKE
ncbi:ATP synthase subunit alpha [Buchnera aphidicola (Eriosoma grossulariae)]|uniref:F0F1 ATP synthase subunit alpha n=1 Tax=Buchnera aphidicola TaxID=9 RepID=UPI00346482FE